MLSQLLGPKRGDNQPHFQEDSGSDQAVVVIIQRDELCLDIYMYCGRPEMTEVSFTQAEYPPHDMCQCNMDLPADKGGGMQND